MNILLWGAFTDAALIADRLGLPEDRADAQKKADSIKQAVYENLWDETNGFFKAAVESPSFGPEANALALSLGLVTPEQALKITLQFKKIAHGKFQSLASRGEFEYGFSQSGLQTILDHNWVKLLDDSWKGATTTTECMNLGAVGWGDDSHPDCAIADHFSGYLLGVRPTTPGYKNFSVKPQPTREVRWAKGVVPTPHGPITASWAVTGDALKLAVTVPKDTSADILLPKGGSVTINGKPGTIENLKAGTYQIEARGLPDGVWKDPTDRQAEVEKELKPASMASSSHEQGGWGIGNLFAAPGDSDKKGYSSGPSATENALEWLEFDLGEETALSKIVLVPRDGKPTSGFPRDFKVQLAKQKGAFTTAATYSDFAPPDERGLSVNLGTVIGFPSARYVRIEVTRLGPPPLDEPGVRRLQFSRVRLQRP